MEDPPGLSSERCVSRVEPMQKNRRHDAFSSGALTTRVAPNIMPMAAGLSNAAAATGVVGSAPDLRR
jgi:hypothetical protein